MDVGDHVHQQLLLRKEWLVVIIVTYFITYCLGYILHV